MSVQVVVVLGLVVWGSVFVCILVAQAMEADVERRWDQQWIMDWESRNHLFVDDLIDRLSHQVGRWKLANRYLTVYLFIAVLALFTMMFFQYWRAMMTPGDFRSAMLFALALTGLLFLPLRVVSEIGLGIVETMHRQVRASIDERVVVESRREIDEIPKPKKEKKKKADEAASAPS